MAKLLRKCSLAATAAVVGLVLSGANSAQAASLNFSLSFFNSTNSLVGEGSFSYDDSTPYEDTFFSSSYGVPPLEIKASNQWFALKSFSATILGLSWNLSQARFDRAQLVSPLLWAPLDPIKTRAVFKPETFGGPVTPQVATQWGFGDIRRPPALGIFGSGFGAQDDRMGWIQTNNQAAGNGSGYVIAEQIVNPCENSEAVPEPGTMAGLTLAAAGLGAAKRKLAASKS